MDKPINAQWQVNCPVKLSVTGTFLRYTGATNGGNSGSPVYRLTNGNSKAYVAGVHVGAVKDAENYAVYIKPNYFKGEVGSYC